MDVKDNQHAKLRGNLNDDEDGTADLIETAGGDGNGDGNAASLQSHVSALFDRAKFLPSSKRRPSCRYGSTHHGPFPRFGTNPEFTLADFDPFAHAVNAIPPGRTILRQYF